MLLKKLMCQQVLKLELFDDAERLLQIDEVVDDIDQEEGERPDQLPLPELEPERVGPQLQGLLPAPEGESVAGETLAVVTPEGEALELERASREV